MSSLGMAVRLRAGRLLAAALLASAAGAAGAASAQAANTYTVSNTGDSGSGSLRQAIEDSNANGPGPNTINFTIVAPGVQTIAPTSPLPPITTPVTIDGTTEPGYVGTPVIQLDGSSAGAGADGLDIQAGTSTVKGLALTGWSGKAIILESKGSDTVAGDYIGTNGTGALANGSGIAVTSASNTIGGTASSDRNVISGNTQWGVVMTGAAATSNLIEGNYVGSDAAGTAAVPNGVDGIELLGGPSGNTIGGTSPQAANLISGNTGDGLGLLAASHNVVEGNLVGLQPGGKAALPNGQAGVAVFGGATDNTIGGGSAAARNVVSGNGTTGIGISGKGTSRNAIEGNYLGTNAAGTAALPNRAAGVQVYTGATSNTVGGTTAGARNVISGNGLYGVVLAWGGTRANRVEGNYIGTTASGTKALANTEAGVAIYGTATRNTVGGTTAGARNLISGNGAGVVISNKGTSGNVVEGNFIGTNRSGKAALPNAGDGVLIVGKASSNRIGGPTVGARNVISGNGIDGVGLHDAGVTGNLVEGNFIGTTAAGTAALPNKRNGVFIRLGATSNTIGGTTAGVANRIAYNKAHGVQIDGAATRGNRVERNSIFANGTRIGISLTRKGNGSQPAPVITRIKNSRHSTTVVVRVPAGKHRVELFVNPGCADPEGKQFLAAVKLKAGTYALTLNSKLAKGHGVTATATNSQTANTSRFSGCKVVP